MTHSLIIALIFIAIVFLAFYFFKISKWISLTLLGIVLAFVLAYLFHPGFQSYVRGKSKSATTELKEKAMDKAKEMGENLKDKVNK